MVVEHGGYGGTTAAPIAREIVERRAGAGVAEMKISELIERLGRTVFEAPFGATAQVMGESPEVAEIRIAVLDEVKKKIQRAGGQALFPYNVVRIHDSRGARTKARSSSAIFSAGFSTKKCARVWRRRPAGFPRICAWRFERRASEGDSGCAWKRWRKRSRRAGGGAPRARRAARSWWCRRERPTNPRFRCKRRASISAGSTDVYKAEGLSRRNDLAFAEDNPINRTVSREHAHILHDKKTGEYRLFNDRWYKRGNKAENNCGLWIVRDGMGQEVHRDTRGTRLLPGDEIHLGKAVVKFQVK